MAQDSLWLWSRLSSRKWEDAWEERLQFLPPGCCALISNPPSRALRIRAYTDGKTGRKLQRYFGGQLKKLAKAEWNGELHRELRPLRVRGKLVIYSDKERWKEHQKTGKTPSAIWIPASMAFGTGSHPTTAGCLRLLADEAARLSSLPWKLADLGTGSGILAIAGKALGAKKVVALDYDSVCIREAKSNARANRIELDQISECDVHQWKPRARFDVISANLFSTTLITAAGQLAAALQKGGTLIFSGVLREQLPEVCAALKEHRIEVLWTNLRGKWVFGLARKRSS